MFLQQTIFPKWKLHFHSPREHKGCEQLSTFPPDILFELKQIAICYNVSSLIEEEPQNISDALTSGNKKQTTSKNNIPFEFFLNYTKVQFHAVFGGGGGAKANIIGWRPHFGCWSPPPWEILAWSLLSSSFEHHFEFVCIKVMLTNKHTDPQHTFSYILVVLTLTPASFCGPLIYSYCPTFRIKLSPLLEPKTRVKR